MYTCHYFMPTLKEVPADAELISHQLMLRAGMIRKLAAGIYTWLPLGLRVLRKVEQVVREEMDRAGAIELLMPVIQPAELWQETDRWNRFGPELLKITDRHDRLFCFGPTHEEVITALVRNEIHSYKQLPLNLYQIQNKFRDEIRPRFGVMRAREFLMKDAYSFHMDKISLQETYDLMYATYTRIFERLDLKFRAVQADTGSIGGHASHEFQVLAQSGEDLIAYSDSSDYAANIELASAQLSSIPRALASSELSQVQTPGITSIEGQAAYLNIQPQQILKTLLVRGKTAEHPFIALLLRGDDELNPVKAEKIPLVATPFTLASLEEIKTLVDCNPGFIGPKDLNMPLIADHAALQMANFVCGANQNDLHYAGFNWGRDCPEPEAYDFRRVKEGDISPDGQGKLQFARGIEVGHIFQLGDKYSKSLDATVLNENGQKIALEMGCYGIGVSRIVAAAIEQNHDENGIIWPAQMAPFDIAIVPINFHKSDRVREASERLYQQLLQQDFSVLLDNRIERPGVMFADMDLIGIPHRIVIGERGLDNGTVEYKQRRATENQQILLTQIVNFLTQRRETTII